MEYECVSFLDLLPDGVLELILVGPSAWLRPMPNVLGLRV